MKKLPFDRHLSLKNVQRVVTEADGYQPHLIAPEQGYRRLIEGCLGYFKGPADASVDAVILLTLFCLNICSTEETLMFLFPDQNLFNMELWLVMYIYFEAKAFIARTVTISIFSLLYSNDKNKLVQRWFSSMFL